MMCRGLQADCAPNADGGVTHALNVRASFKDGQLPLAALGEKGEVTG